ncbi:MAG TPA: tRNA (adenosine(37)-N6)-threonylcarbamoyltransferase complex dimerization subunit type 1 TsaB [Bacillota bacterium]|nr:tRNA (adenosine(37)-N6)-threonylcarbamoyltransferase complex dimerization subunit type 1 TsaB [Bacillota bacterium]
MVILAIDTTELTATAAITCGELPLAARQISGTRTHSETMLPLVLELLEETGLTFSDIELYACSAGPGSFTGVRIGVSLIKGFAFGRSGKDGAPVPCSGVSALHALAYNLRGLGGEPFVACPVMDARRERFYNAMFEVSSGEITRLCPDRAISAEELAAELAQKYLGRRVILCGGGTALAATAFSHLPNVSPAPGELLPECGVSVAVCAYRDFYGTREYVRDAATLAPIYLRPPQAERSD